MLSIDSVLKDPHGKYKAILAKNKYVRLFLNTAVMLGTTPQCLSEVIHFVWHANLLGCPLRSSTSFIICWTLRLKRMAITNLLKRLLERRLQKMVGHQRRLEISERVLLFLAFNKPKILSWWPNVKNVWNGDLYIHDKPSAQQRAMLENKFEDFHSHVAVIWLMLD